LATLFFKNTNSILSNKDGDGNDKKINKFVDSELPSFEYKDTKGKTVNSVSLRGRPIIINLWFTAFRACVADGTCNLPHALGCAE